MQIPAKTYVLFYGLWIKIIIRAERLTYNLTHKDDIITSVS